jgi:drug/metabolite transporter (DMT)-like permease
MMSRSADKGHVARVLREVGTPALFVFLWSTGFIGAKLGLPYAGPLTFLALRFALAAALLLLLALATRAPWPGQGVELVKQPC